MTVRKAKTRTQTWREEVGLQARRFLNNLISSAVSPMQSRGNSWKQTSDQPPARIEGEFSYICNSRMLIARGK